MNFYELLGVAPDAEQGEIRTAFRRLARQHHPDVSAYESAARFRLLKKAYETLSDPRARAVYDTDLDESSVPVRIVHRSARFSEPEALAQPYRSTRYAGPRPDSPGELIEAMDELDRLFIRFLRYF